MYDLFISHAREDKAELVEPLVAALRDRGLAVWYDAHEILLGDDFRRKMDEGLDGSYFGVVVLSPSFRKYWPEAELSALMNQERTFDTKRILPVVHGLTPREVTEAWPLLAARAAVYSSDGVEAVADRILDALRPAAPAASGEAAGLSRPGGQPFEAWKPVVPPFFVGRRSALHRLESALGSRDGVSIVGDGRIGKSSLLATWRQKLRHAGRKVCLVDGQGAAGGSEAAFVAAVTGRPAPDGVEAAADALAEWAAGEPAGLAPVVLVDEIDHLPARFEPRFFERLRNLLGQIVLVVASRREVDTLYQAQGLTSPFDNRLRLIRLGLLDKTAAEELVRRGTGVLDAEDEALMRRQAGRHPFYLQLLGYSLVESRELGESRAQALDRFRDQAGVRLRELWGRLDDRHREALRRAARGEPVTARPLVWRGLLDDDGRPFGEVLASWLREMA